jgi:hypothetical protein
METSNWIVIRALARSLFLWIERRSRKAQFEDKRAHREEQLHLMRLQVQADESDLFARLLNERAVAAEAKALSPAHIIGDTRTLSTSYERTPTSPSVAKRATTSLRRHSTSAFSRGRISRTRLQGYRPRIPRSPRSLRRRMER